MLNSSTLARRLPRPLRLAARNVRDAALRLGVGPKLEAENRRILEDLVFPWFNREPSCRRLLFVGCHWYTWHYKTIFAGKEFWTLDILPEQARYGANRHVVDSVEHVERHFLPGALDAVMMIGVIGWGLNEPAAIETSLSACSAVLRPGGLLLLGCDEIPERMPVDLAHSAALRELSPFVFPPLKAATHRCVGDLNHTLTFYQKPR